MSKKKTLADIFNDDEFGILDSKPKNAVAKTEDERLIESFQEINTFFEKNNREPEATNVTEFKLLSRLKAIRLDANKVAILKSYDKNNLLITKEEVKSIEDILEDDDLGILDTEGTLAIFKLKNVPSEEERAEADFKARRKPMKEKDFAPYEVKFKKIQQELKEGKRKLVGFNYESLKPNEYYINNGVMLYLESVKWEKEIQEFNSGVHNRPDGRTKIIFENGTRSNMMFQSLYKVLHFNGQMVTNTDDAIEDELLKNSNIVQDEDVSTGWIYVLKSKSDNPEIASIENLYKIGFSSIDIEERIKNSAKQPTYLMGDVQVISTYKCYNINPEKFEQLLHRFFAKACLNVDVFDTNGRRFTPREWFIVPLSIIDKVIILVLKNEILNYEYDPQLQSLLKKKNN